MNNMEELISNMKTKEDFLFFINSLVLDFRSNSDLWENKTLDTYFESLSGWVEDMEGYYENNKIEDVDLSNVNWRVFADILLAAKYYE